MTQQNNDPNSPNNPHNRPEHDNSNEFAKIGRMMFFMAGGLMILMLMFGQWEDRQFNPNSSPTSSIDEMGHRSVTLERNRYGHYVTAGSINGQKVTFLLDTGATQVAIPGQLEHELRLRRGRPHQVNTANGTALAYQTHLDHLKIGEIVLYDVDATIAPSMQGEEILLGMSVLKRLDFEQSGNLLTLTQ